MPDPTNDTFGDDLETEPATFRDSFHDVRRYDRKTERGLRPGMLVGARRWTPQYSWFEGRIESIDGDNITIKETIYRWEDGRGREQETGGRITVPRHLVRHARAAEKGRSRERA